MFSLFDVGLNKLVNTKLICNDTHMMSLLYIAVPSGSLSLCLNRGFTVADGLEAGHVTDGPHFDHVRRGLLW